VLGVRRGEALEYPQQGVQDGLTLDCARWPWPRVVARVHVGFDNVPLGRDVGEHARRVVASDVLRHRNGVTSATRLADRPTRKSVPHLGAYESERPLVGVVVPCPVVVRRPLAIVGVAGESVAVGVFLRFDRVGFILGVASRQKLGDVHTSHYRGPLLSLRLCLPPLCAPSAASSGTVGHSVAYVVLAPSMKGSSGPMSHAGRFFFLAWSTYWYVM